MGQLSRRDTASSALALAFFGVGWFGWGQAKPPGWAPAWLGIGEAISLLVVIASAVTAFREPRATALPVRDRAAFRKYLIVFWGEIAVILVAAVILAFTGASAYLPAAICAAVGLHFIPLSAVVRDRPLIPLGATVTAVAVAALTIGLTTHVSPSTITGFGAGGALVGYAAWSLVRARRLPTARSAATAVQG